MPTLGCSCTGNAAYFVAEVAGASTDRLDGILAVAPWRTPDMYEDLVQLGVLDRLEWPTTTAGE